MRLVSLGNQNALRKSWSKEDDIVQLAKPDDTIYKIMGKSQIAYLLRKDVGCIHPTTFRSMQFGSFP